LSEDNKRILEIKCIKAEYHAQALGGKVPDLYWPQVQHQLLVTGLRKLDYWSYSESTKFPLPERVALVEVIPDREYQQELFEAEKAFQESLNGGSKGKEAPFSPSPELEAYWKSLVRQ
jgi:predicted phage-related endonuclease